jgi:hypothetical protein
MTTTVGSGVGASLGMSIEGVWGTWGASSKWVEPESFGPKFKPNRKTGTGLAGGRRVARRSSRVTTTSEVIGDVKCPIYYKGMGQLLGLAQGSLAVAPVQQGATTAYLQTHNESTPTKSLSMQAGIPELGGTVRQRNWAGLMCTQLVLECGIDEYLMGTWSLDGRSEETSSAFGTPTYQTPNPIHAFNEATFKMGALGSEAVVEGVRKVTLTAKIPLHTKGFYQDGTGLKQQQVLNGFKAFDLVIESDYLHDADFVAQFVSDTPQSLIWTFPSTLLAGTAIPFAFTAAIPSCSWDEGAPDVPGPDVIMPNLKLTGLSDDTNNPFQITYMSTDVTL